MGTRECAAETGNLVYTSELGNEAYFSQYDGRDDLGNNQPRDGSRFRGRGMIQITGRSNYTNFETYVRTNIPKYALLDVTSSKDKATQIATNLELGVLASLWYWVYGEKSQKIANSVNSDDIYWVSVYVNGRKVQAHPYYANRTTEPNHMQRRIEATNKAKQILGV